MRCRSTPIGSCAKTAGLVEGFPKGAPAPRAPGTSVLLIFSLDKKGRQASVPGPGRRRGPRGRDCTDLLWDTVPLMPRNVLSHRRESLPRWRSPVLTHEVSSQLRDVREEEARDVPGTLCTSWATG